jgi:23S rRNA (cytosine1962-C5)-methyltransferase
MTLKPVVLKPQKEKAIKNKHHWIFSGAIAELPEFKNGDILPVHSSRGEFLGCGYFNHKTSIRGRMLTFDNQDPLEAISQSMEAAIQLRKTLFNPQHTNAYRLINGEGDFLPGLIVDKYHDVLVVQISTMGMDKLRDFIIEQLIKKLKPQAIYENSKLPSRKEEGLNDVEGFRSGSELAEVEIKENGLRYLVSLTGGQKTGFFLDHREMRLLIGQLAKERKVLNCFAYTGAFSVSAAAGQAQSTVSVELSESAIVLAKSNFLLNQLDPSKNSCVKADVFHYLRENALDFDLVILDPPAFAKKQKDVIAACRGYKDINRLAMQKMPPKSLLLTSSCSYYVPEDLFQKVVFQAAVEAKRKIRILERHRQAFDHPINLCHPESDYLKSLLLYLE